MPLSFGLMQLPCVRPSGVVAALSRKLTRDVVCARQNGHKPSILPSQTSSFAASALPVRFLLLLLCFLRALPAATCATLAAACSAALASFLAASLALRSSVSAGPEVRWLFQSTETHSGCGKGQGRARIICACGGRSPVHVECAPARGQSRGSRRRARRAALKRGWCPDR
eukprot:scaffold13448_cov109-Isochrysis_galbana.AAC.7